MQTLCQKDKSWAAIIMLTSPQKHSIKRWSDPNLCMSDRPLLKNLVVLLLSPTNLVFHYSYTGNAPVKQQNKDNIMPKGKTDVCARESDCSLVFVPNFTHNVPPISTPCAHDKVKIQPQQVQPGREDRASSWHSWKSLLYVLAVLIL